MKPKESRSVLARRLRYLRTVSDVTQAQLADILGIRRETYANYEMGRACPNQVLIKQLAEFFNVDPALLTNDSEMELPIPYRRLNDAVFVPVQGVSSLSEEEKKLVFLFRQMEETQQKDLIRRLEDDSLTLSE